MNHETKERMNDTEITYREVYLFKTNFNFIM
jgi:hypothetical protein